MPSVGQNLWQNEFLIIASSLCQAAVSKQKGLPEIYCQNSATHCVYLHKTVQKKAN